MRVRAVFTLYFGVTLDLRLMGFFERIEYVAWGFRESVCLNTDNNRVRSRPAYLLVISDSE